MGRGDHIPGQDDRVTCAVRNKEIPKSLAKSSEATDYVVQFLRRKML